MSHKDTGWRAPGARETYNGFEVWDHGVQPHESNEAEIDGDLNLTE